MERSQTHCVAYLANIEDRSISPHQDKSAAISHHELDDLIFIETIDSTNLELKRRRQDFRGSNVLLISDEQTAGQGQKGRNWESAAGQGLWMSLQLGRSNTLSNDLQLLSLYTGLVVHKIISAHLPLSLTLKWPNDIMIGHRKCGGILTELHWQGEQATSAIIGIGVNLTHGLMDFPPDLREQAISLAMAGWQTPDRQVIINSFINEFFDQMVLLNHGSQVARLWNDLAYGIGQTVQWESERGKIQGLFSGINAHGEAMIMVSGVEKKFSTGEVSLKFD